MKNQFTKFVAFAVALSLLLSCNQSVNQNETEISNEQKAFNELFQGVFEYTFPHKGLAMIFNNHFIFIINNTDTTMVSRAGTCSVSGDTVTYQIEYASKKKLNGQTFSFKITDIEKDTIIAQIINPFGELSEKYEHVRLTKVKKENLENAVYEYLAPMQGKAMMLGNNFLYLGGVSDSTMVAHGGSYTLKTDTFTNKILYATYPFQEGSEFKWSYQSAGDTMLWTTYKNDGKISSQGKSLKVGKPMN